MPSTCGPTDPPARVRLIGFDSVIETDLTLPGGIPAPTGALADITIATAMPASLPPGPPPLYRHEQDGLTFTAPGVAAYRCTRDCIIVAPWVGSDPAAVSGLLVATAMPAALWLRGDVVLHATALCLPGSEHAIAFCGPSGVGKSTVAAQLLDRSAQLVADDSVRLTPRGPVTVSGLPGGLHQGSAAARHFVSLPPDRIIRSAPLGGIVILSRGSGGPLLSRLAPHAALEQLLANQHRPRIPALLGRRGEVLRFLAYLSRNVPVYSWQRGTAELGAEEYERVCALSGDGVTQ